MKRATKILLIPAVALGAIAAQPAMARQNRGGHARADLPADGAASAAGAKLHIRMHEKGSARAEFRMTLERAPTGLSLEAWIADDAGALVLAGPMAANGHHAREYRLRLRTRDGAVLPVDAAAIADLAGRAFEVRSGGEVLVAGTMPDVKARGGHGGGGDDGPGHDAGDDHGAGDDDGADHDAGDDHGGGSGH